MYNFDFDINWGRWLIGYEHVPLRPWGMRDHLLYLGPIGIAFSTNVRN